MVVVPGRVSITRAGTNGIAKAGTMPAMPTTCTGSGKYDGWPSWPSKLLPQHRTV